MTLEELKRRMAIQQAFLDGKRIQYRCHTSSVWNDWEPVNEETPAQAPSFDWTFRDWRIKPEPRVFFVPEYPSGLSAGHFDKPVPWERVVRWHRFIEDVSYGEEK